MLPAPTKAIWMPKGYEPYNQGTDDDYYLGLGKENVLKAKWDMLGHEILTGCSTEDRVGEFCEPTWSRMVTALPVMRYSQGNKNARAGGQQEWMCSPYGEESGVRTFVGESNPLSNRESAREHWLGAPTPLRPPSTPPARPSPSRSGTLVPSVYADARYIDAVIVSQAPEAPPSTPRSRTTQTTAATTDSRGG